MPKPTQSHPPSALNSLADASVMTALFTVLVFQNLRFEGFETEKSALLMLIGGVLAGVIVTDLMNGKFAPATGLLRHPVVIGAGFLLIISFVSTLTSLSFQRSMWGAPDRGHGFVVQLAHALIFIQTLRSGQLLLHQLPFILIIIAVPLCAYGLLTYADGLIERPGSTTGNPNYLASWLMMATLLSLTYLRVNLRKPGHAKLNTFVFLIIALMVLTMIIAGSRGALLGLVTGAFVFHMIWLAIHRNRRLLIVTSMVVSVALGVYLLISTQVESGNLQGLGRIFQPYDEFRVVAWEGATQIIRDGGEPMLTVSQSPDVYAKLRPLVGYGPDTIALLHDRFKLAAPSTIYANSFHNLVFDTTIMTGFAGLFAQIVIFGGAVLTILFSLGLLTWRMSVWWLLVEILSGILAAIMIHLISDQSLSWALVFVGLALGFALGIIIWVVLISLKGLLPDYDPRQLWQFGLLAIVVARWVELQFGFVQVASEPLWWIILGLVVGQTRQQEAASPQEVETGRFIYAGIAATGASLVLGLGASIDSSFVLMQDIPDYLPRLLPLVGITGIIIVWSWFQFNIIWFVAALLIWPLSYLLLTLLNPIAGNALDQMIELNTASVKIGLFSLGLKGVLVILLIMIAFLWAYKVNIGALMRPELTLVLLFTVGGAAYYLSNHTGSVLHHTANSLSATDQTQFIETADSIYTAGASLLAYDSRLRIDQAYNALKMASPDSDTVNDPLTALFKSDPFYVHSLAWQVFSNAYQRQ